MAETSKTEAHATKFVLTKGINLEVTFEGNRMPSKLGSVKGQKTNLGKFKKIILIDAEYRGVHPKPGEVWVCRVVDIKSPNCETKGSIIVRPLSRKLEFNFDDVYVPPLTARLMCTVLQDPNKNLMMEGDQGVGKSTIAHAVARILGWEFRKVSGGLIKKFVYMLGRYVPYVDDQPLDAEALSEDLIKELSKLEPSLNKEAFGFSKPNLAVLKLLASFLKTSSLKFKWMDSKLVEVLREAARNPHKIFLLMIDEYTRIDSDARDALLDVIEGLLRALRLPTGEEILVPKNVVFMAAGNVGEGFTIQRQDAAAKSRWVIVKIYPMPPEAEIPHCLRKYPGAPRAELERAIAIINAIRAARRDPKMRLSKITSTREAEATAMFLADGIALDVALDTAVVNQYDGRADDRTTEAGRVAKLIEEELAKKAA